MGLPIAKFFRAFSGDGVFQQPQAITLNPPSPGVMSAMGIFHQSDIFAARRIKADGREY